MVESHPRWVLLALAVTKSLSSPSKRQLQLPDLPLPRRGRLNHHPPFRRRQHHDHILYFILLFHHPRYHLPSPQSRYSPSHHFPKRARQTSRRLPQLHHRPSLTADQHLQSRQSQLRRSSLPQPQTTARMMDNLHLPFLSNHCGSASTRQSARRHRPKHPPWR